MSGTPTPRDAIAPKKSLVSSNLKDHSGSSAFRDQKFINIHLRAKMGIFTTFDMCHVAHGTIFPWV